MKRGQKLDVVCANTKSESQIQIAYANGTSKMNFQLNRTRKPIERKQKQRTRQLCVCDNKVASNGREQKPNRSKIEMSQCTYNQLVVEQCDYDNISNMNGTKQRHTENKIWMRCASISFGVLASHLSVEFQADGAAQCFDFNDTQHI